jgi:hypothetical protein
MPRGAERTAGVFPFATVNDCLGTKGSVHQGVHMHTSGFAEYVKGGSCVNPRSKLL